MTTSKTKSSLITVPMAEKYILDAKESVKPIGVERLLVFDIDGTLYPASCGVHPQLLQRIEKFGENLGLSKEQAKAARQKYHKEYGTSSMIGYVKDFSITPDHWNDFVFGGLELESLGVKTNEELQLFLNSLPERKWCFTNAGIKHAKRVLGLLGVTECFEGIVYCDYMLPSFRMKAQKEAFSLFEQLFECSDRSLLCFVDDDRENVTVSKEIGWNSALLEPNDNLIHVVSRLLQK